jgi:26S proteasome regulatory subunit N12
LEGLEVRGERVEGDKYLAYPIKLERWLMEGSYDLVWRAMAAGEVPSEEYSVFSEVSNLQCILIIKNRISIC